MRLRFDEATGCLKLTCPPRASRRAALAWALSQRAWIDRQIASQAPVLPFEPGGTIPVEGVETRLVWVAEDGREVRSEPGSLRCGGPEAGFARRIEAYLKRLALTRMSAEVADYCARAGAPARAVASRRRERH